MQDPLAPEPVAAALGHPEMGETMALPAATSGAARIPAGRVADADEYAMVAADRASTPDLVAGELAAVAQPCADQTADVLQLWRETGVILRSGQRDRISDRHLRMETMILADGRIDPSRFAAGAGSFDLTGASAHCAPGRLDYLVDHLRTGRMSISVRTRVRHDPCRAIDAVV